MLKCIGPMAKEWIYSLLNQGIAQGFSQGFSQGSRDNVINKHYKEGNINQFTNYQTIMFGPCMEKRL